MNKMNKENTAKMNKGNTAKMNKGNTAKEIIEDTNKQLHKYFSEWVELHKKQNEIKRNILFRFAECIDTYDMINTYKGDFTEDEISVETSLLLEKAIRAIKDLREIEKSIVDSKDTLNINMNKLYDKRDKLLNELSQQIIN